MTDRKRLFRIAALAFLSLFLIGAIEFLIQAIPGRRASTGDVIELTLIVGATYGFLGAIGSILISILLLLARRVHRGIPIEFSLYLLWGLVLFAYLGYRVNARWLAGTPITHPLSLLVSLILLVLCVGVFYLIYRLLRPSSGGSSPSNHQPIL